MRNVFIPIEINHWKGKSTYVESVYFEKLERAKEYIDSKHRCEKTLRYPFCDYCKVLWKDSKTGSKKIVDHDGAVVEYIVQKLILIS